MKAVVGSPLVALRDVDKKFGSAVSALHGVNLEIHDGEFISILGPSGCGKSTILRIVAGLTEPTEGDIVRNDGESAGLGFVFQDPTLLPWKTVAGNVFLPLKLAGISRQNARSDIYSALDSVGLREFADSYPRQLSGGMKMRVSIARALVTKPKLLLMDEPFAALDEITRFRLNNDLLRVWQSRGGAVVFVTHSVFESVFLSRRIVVMTSRPGRVFTQLNIDAPYPREESFRTSAEYAGYCRRASQALAAAMETGSFP